MQDASVVSFTTNQQIEENRQRESEQRRAQAMAVLDIESRVSSHIGKAWERNKLAKQKVEKRMLQSLRQRIGEYDADVMAQIKDTGGSEIYMMLTATKVRAAISWIRDILLPAKDKAWGLDPTPIPDLPPEIIGMIQQRVVTEAQQLMGDQPITPDLIKQKALELRDATMANLKTMAKEAAERMEDKIEDQLAEGKWVEALTEYIDDYCTFPAAILKGPVARKRQKLTWSSDFKPVVQEQHTQETLRVSPFDIYPSPDAVDVEDGDFIERLRLKRSDIYNCIGLPHYSEENIRKVLKEYGRGGLRHWLWSDTERETLEGKEGRWLSGDGTIDGIHYWGSVQGLMLLEWGVDPQRIDDPLAEYQVEAIKIGSYVIKLSLNNDPLARRPYYKSSYQKRPGSFWGDSVPDLMRDIQKMCNAVARSLANNLGLASGPQVEIHTDRLAPGEDVTQVYPWKIWQTISDQNGGAGSAAVRFFQPDSHANELLAVYKEFELRADDATNIPRYTYGNERIGGAGGTASGLSMLMNAASKGIRGAIANIDLDVISKVVERLHFFNMIHDPDPSIKGDVNVVARGATALIAREQAQMRLNELLQTTNNPVDMKILGVEGRYEMLKDVIEGSEGISSERIVPNRDKFKANLEQEKKNQPPNPDMLELEQDAKEHDDQMQLEYARLQNAKDLKMIGQGLNV